MSTWRLRRSVDDKITRAEDTGLEPAALTPEVVADKALTFSASMLVADGQRTSCSCRQPMAPTGTNNLQELEAELALVVTAWPDLLPHIRETIHTLVTVSLAGRVIEKPDE